MVNVQNKRLLSVFLTIMLILNLFSFSVPVFADSPVYIVNTAAPVISGSTEVGGVLTTTDGSWSYSDGQTVTSMTYGYQWEKVSNLQSVSSAVYIENATASQYTTTVADEGMFIRARVTVSDGSANSGQAFSNWIQIGSNLPPIINEGTATSITMPEGSNEKQFTLTATDTENSAITWSVTSEPSFGSAEVIDGSVGNSKTFKYMLPDSDTNGTTSFTVTATDASGLSSSIIVNVDVTPVNDAPYFTKGSDITVPEDSEQFSAVWATGISAGAANENEMLTFNITGNSNPSLFSQLPVIAQDGTITCTPAENANGTSVIKVKLSDEGGLFSNEQSFNITVSPVNDLPYFTKGPDVTVTEDSVAYSAAWATGLSTGASNETQTLTFSITQNDNTGLFESQPAIASDGKLSFKPKANAFGTANIKVRLSDGIDTSAEESFAINVMAVNDAPSFTKGANQIITEDSGAQSVSGWASAISKGPSNEQDQTLEFVVSNDNNLLFDIQPSVSADGTLTYTPRANANGIALVSVIARDYGGVAEAVYASSAAQTFTINITPINDAPLLGDIPSVSGAEDVSSLNTVFTVDDVDNTVNLLSISAVSSNKTLLPDSNIVISGTGNSRNIKVVPMSNQFGTSIVTVTVSDGVLSVAKSFTVTIDSVNDLPTITCIANQTINEDGSTGSLLFYIDDVETAAEDLQVSAESDLKVLFPNAISIQGTGSNRSISLSAKANLSGAEKITITVTDGNGATVQTSFTVTVNSSNDLPTITVPGETNIDEDTETGELLITVGDVETPAENLTVTATSANTNVIPDDNIVLGGSGANRTIKLIPLADSNGSSLITVKVVDENGGSREATFRVNVSPVNDAPVITAPSNVSIDEDITVSEEYTFTVSDIDNNSVALNVTAASSDETIIPNENIIIAGTGNERTIKVIPLEDKFGPVTVTLSVYDGSLTANNSFIINVLNVNDAPEIGKIADQQIGQDSSTEAMPFKVWDIDDAAETLLLTAETDNQELIPNDNAHIIFGGSGENRTVKIVPAEGKSGTAIITVSVTDSGLLSDQQAFIVIVSPAGGSSVISNVLNQVIDEDTDTGYIYFSVQSDYPGVTINTADETIFPTLEFVKEDGQIATGIVLEAVGEISNGRQYYRTKLTPAKDQNGGPVAVTVTAKKDENTIATEVFNVTVTPVNDLPVISGSDFIQMEEDQDVQDNSTISISDVDVGQTLTVNVVSTNQVLFPLANLEMSGEGTNRALKIKPDLNTNGNSIITVTVSDGIETVEKNFYVDVSPVNDAPELTQNIEDQTINEDTVLGPIDFTVNDVETAAGSLVVWATSSNTALVPNNNISIAGSGSTRNIKLTPAKDMNKNTSASGEAITITLHVSDGKATSTDSFLLFVEPVNDAPSVGFIANQTISEDGTTGNLAFTIGDIDTPLSEVTVSAVSSNTDLIPNGSIEIVGNGNSDTQRTIKLTPSANQYGTATITVTASDGQLSGSRTFTLNILPVNDAPTVTVDSAITIDEDSQTTVPIPFSIADIETPAAQLVLTVSSGNETLLPQSGITLVKIDDANYTISLKPDANQNGTMLIPIKVSDGDITTLKNIIFTVNPINDIPTITQIADKTINEDSGAITIPFTVDDIETSAGSLLVTAVSSDTSLVPAANITLGGSGASRTIKLVPVTNGYGYTDITVKVFDGIDATPMNFRLNVQPVNDIPSFTIGNNQTVLEDSGLVTVANWIKTVSVGPANESTQIPSYIITGNTNTALFIQQPYVDSNGTLTFTPKDNISGTATITLKVNDGGGTDNGGKQESLTQSFTITVASVNDAPSFTAGEDLSVNEDCGAVTEAAWAKDISKGPSNESAQVLAFTVTNNNNALFLVQPAIDKSTGNLTFTPAANAAGAAVVTVVLADNGGTANHGNNTSAAQNFTITVNPVNDAPSFTPGDSQSVNEDSGAQTIANWVKAVSAGPSNESTQTVSYQIVSNDRQDMFQVQPYVAPDGTLTYTPKVNTSGTATIYLKVVDDGGTDNGGVDESSLKAFTITLNSVNYAPVFVQTEPVSVTMSEDSDPIPFKLTLEASDADGDTIVWSITKGPEHGTASTSEDAAGNFGDISYLPTADYYGNDSIIVTISDGQGGEKSITVNIIIEPVNDLPLTTDYGYIMTSGSVIKGAVKGSDIDGDTLVYSMITDEKDIEGTFVLNGSTGEWVYSSSSGYVGIESVKVQVSDQNGGTAVSSITIDVRALEVTAEYIESTVKNVPLSSFVSLTALAGKTITNELGILPMNGSVVLAENGCYTYTPDNNFVGTDKFTILSTDENGTKLLQQVKLTVNEKNLVLKGIVRDVDTTEVIPGASVQLLDIAGKQIKSTTTGTDGTYSFSGLVENNYKIVVSHKDYSENKRVSEVTYTKADSEGIIIENFNLADFTIDLTANPTSIIGDGKDQTLLTAVLLNKFGEPISNVKVDFKAEGNTGSFVKDGQVISSDVYAYTDANGQAQMYYRSIDLSMTSTDYLNVPVTVSVSDTQRGLFSEENIFITFAPGYITGVVVDNDTGKPVSGANVRVYKDFDDDGITDFSFSQTTGSDGKYKIAIPKGGISYEIVITKPITIGDTTIQIDFLQKVMAGSVQGKTPTEFSSNLTAAGIIISRNSDGSVALKDDFENLKLEIQNSNGEALSGFAETINTSNGVFNAENLNANTDYYFVVKYKFDSGEEIIVGKVKVNLNDNGEINISQILIDPYGVITDSETGSIIEGAQVQLYYADTERNRNNNITPGTVVSLPALKNFPPANNKNPQSSDSNGKYAFMVFPHTDYYIVAKKDGYDTYTSNTISVEAELVLHDIKMTKTVNKPTSPGGAADVIIPQAPTERDLAVTIETDKIKVSEGSQVQLTVPFANKSTIDVSNVVITVYVPEGMQVADSNGGEVNGSVITWKRSNLKAGVIDSLSFILKADPIGSGEVYKLIKVAIGSNEELSSTEDDKSKLQIMIYSNNVVKTHTRYIKGMPDGEFKPQYSLTRAEAAAIFARLLPANDRVLGASSGYSDVNNSHWAAEYIATVTQKGLMKGREDGFFAPDEPIKRAELATIIARYFDLERKSAASAIRTHYTDTVGHWAEGNIEEVYRYKIISGYEDGSFRPENSITRAEAVTMINRMLYRGPIVGSEGDVFPDVKADFWGAGQVDESYRTHQYIINDDGTETVTKYIEESLW